jgi:hypothetical protein
MWEPTVFILRRLKEDDLVKASKETESMKADKYFEIVRDLKKKYTRSRTEVLFVKSFLFYMELKAISCHPIKDKYRKALNTAS